MVGFKEWSDYNKFMRKYALCCCQNCVGFSHKQDMDSGQFVCVKTLSPVRLDLIKVCVEWQDSDGRVPDDFDGELFPFKFSEDIWDKLISIDEELTFEEIKEIIEDEEH